MRGLASRKLRALDGLVSPPAFFLGANGAGEVAAGDGSLGATLGPGRPGLNPVLEEGDFVFRQTFAFGRHHLLGVGREDILQEEALGWIARNQGRATVTTRGQAGEGVHDQASLILARGMAVALEATGIEEGDGLLGLCLVRRLDYAGPGQQGR